MSLNPLFFPAEAVTAGVGDKRDAQLIARASYQFDTAGLSLLFPGSPAAHAGELLNKPVAELEANLVGKVADVAASLRRGLFHF